MPVPFDSSGLGEVLAAHGVGILVAFGSRVRGAARPSSDLDLGVLRADGRSLSHRQLADLLADLQPRTPHDIDLVDLATADVLLRFELLKHHEPLFVDQRDQWVDLATRTLIEMDELEPFLDELVQGVRRRAMGSA